jgi:hypothetical protein
VRDGRHHVGGLAHDAGQWRHAGVAHVRDQFPHAETADLFLVGECQVNGKRGLAFQEIAGMRQCDRNEAFHVGRTAAVQPTVLYGRAQRIG